MNSYLQRMQELLTLCSGDDLCMEIASALDEEMDIDEIFDAIEEALKAKRPENVH